VANLEVMELVLDTTDSELVISFCYCHHKMDVWKA